MKKHLLFKLLLNFCFSLFLSVGLVNGQETLIISEVTDPGDVANAKYVELYNATDTDIDLSTWQIRRYANGSTSSTNATLAGTLASGETYLVAGNETEFTTQYGFAPDQSSSAISGNGDDVYELFDGVSVIDIYGEVGVDGTGTAWEYENSQAVRVATVGSGNTTWTASEWTIAAADVADMTPGEHTCDYPPVDTPPEATFDPTDGETFVAIDKTITITFDEKIYQSDGTTEIVDGDLSALITFKETNGSGADVAATMTYDNSTYTITIDPTSNLTNGLDYYVAFGSVYDDAQQENAGENITFTTIPSNYVQLTYPVGSEKLYAGDEITVNWNSANVTNVDILAYVPETDTWELMLDDTPSDGTESFTIPTDAGYSTLYKLAIQDISNPSTIADTSATFTVISTPTINDIQSDHTGGMSNYDGDIVRTSGIITFSGTGEYVIQDGAGSWNGIYVYDYAFDNTSVEGDSVIIEAEVGNYNDVTQLKNVVDLTVVESGKPLPEITTITTSQLTEEYEGVLLQVVNAQVTTDPASGSFEIDDGSGALIVDDNLWYDSEAGVTIGRDLTITGIGHQNTNFQLLPRSASDIVSATDTVGSTEYDIDQVSLEITNIPFSTTLADFKTNIEAADSATFDVFDSDGTTPATVLDDTKLLIVTAADGITEATYTITKNAALTDATVSSSVYTVDDGAETITDIPIGTDLATFESNITPPLYGSFEVYESDGTTEAIDLATDYILTGTAEDGTTTKDYTITVNTVAMDEDSYVGEPTTQIPAATIAVVDGDETAEAFEVFSFDINDAGTSDGEPTNVSQMVIFYGPNFTLDLETEVDSGWFEVDGTPVDFDGEPEAGLDSIAFSFADGQISVPDGGSVNVVLKLVLSPTVADGKVIQFMIDADQHGFEAKTSGSDFAADFVTDIVGNDITIDVVATELNFSTEPTDVYIDAMITPAVVVEAIDANGNIDTDYTTDVSITATGATLGGSPVVVTPVAGVATFDALSFSDAGTGVTLTASSGTITDATSATFDVTAAPESDLFFSEYIEGSSNNKALEIYNPTAADIDLSDYVIRINANGGDWTSVFEFPAGTMLASDNVYVIAHADADEAILAETDTAVVNPYSGGESYVAVFNGNDVRALCKVEGEDTTIIDIIGKYDGIDPGSGWSVAGVDNATANHTLVRKSSIIAGNPDWDSSAGNNETDSEWIVLEENYFESIGTHAIGLSSDAEILDFTFGVEYDLEEAVIDSANATVEITVINGTDASALTPMITISDGATIDPESDVEQDFTNPVVYTVTAEDGTTTKDWTVTVTVSSTLSDQANIIEVELADVDSININDTDTTVTIYAPYGFDATSVKPEFTVSAGATIADTATARDFTNPQVYVVTAQDGTTIKNWEVSIDVVEATAATIYDIQYTDDASGDSPYLGELVLTSGIVTYINSSNVWIQDGSGAWNGVMVYSSDMASAVAIGDEVEFVAEVDEYYNLTELKNVVGLTIVSSDNDLPAAAEITTLEANDEDYESVLVKVSDATCTNEDAGFGMFVVNDGSGEILIDDVFYAFIPTLDIVYDITGIADYSFSERKILPRNENDIVEVTTGINKPEEIVSMNIYPNPSNGEFTFEMNASKAGTFNVEIINIQGQVIYQKQITQDGFYRESIDISEKARGIYYIRINDGKSMKISKIMIQ